MVGGAHPPTGDAPGHGDGRAVRGAWRARARASVRPIAGTAVVIALCGTVALAAVAAARRTASTFHAYRVDADLSDVVVNTPVPDLERVAAVAALPGVVHSATMLGLNAFPIVDGRPVEDFTSTGTFASLDGRYLHQDRATVVAGRLPADAATDEMALSPGAATALGVGVGDALTYEFRDPTSQAPLGRATLRVVGLVRLPPVIVDENDVLDGAVLPPAVTAAHLAATQYAFQGLRLARGVAGIDDFVAALVADPVAGRYPPIVQRIDDTSDQVQRSIRPEAVALALFGAAAALAAVALGGQAVARLVGRWGPDDPLLRALGFTRTQRRWLYCLDAVVAIGAGLVAAAAAALVASPLAPTGDLRRIAPGTGIDADATVLVGGTALLAVVLLAIAAASAHRTAGPVGARAPQRPSRLVARATRCGVPLAGAVGAGWALVPTRGRRAGTARVPVLGTAVALLAVVAALVFASSLGGLVSTPARYGWPWDRTLVAEAGYGALDPGVVTTAIGDDPGVTGWSLLAFDSLDVDGQPVAVIGLERHAGDVQPPIVSGRAPRGRGEIALGRATLDALGREVGDAVTATAGGAPVELRIVGAVTLPAIGRGGVDHTSLGRGGLLTLDGLVAVRGAPPCGTGDGGLCANAVVLDVASREAGDAVVGRVTAANPDGVPGGTYEQPVTRSADIRNFDQMRTIPVVLALSLAGVAVIGSLFALQTSTRAARHDLAVLQAIGLTRRQVRTVVVAQGVTMAAVAIAVGVPLGIVTGRISWRRFAHGVGVVPHPSTPAATVVAVAVGTAGLGALLALGPAWTATRTSPARTLRDDEGIARA